MILVITEKNNAAVRIADILADTKKKTDKVYNTPVYRFTHEGEEWVAIGLAGHILEVEFVNKLQYDKKTGWYGIDENDNQVPAPQIPDKLGKPPFDRARSFTKDSVSLKGWNIPVLPYLVYAPIIKYPAEKDIIRSLKNLAKKADSVIIATDFDREGELIGAEALDMVREVTQAPVSRARYSALTRGEITHAFDNLVELDIDLAMAGESRRYIDLVWGAVLTRYLTSARYSGFGNSRSAGRVQTPTLALIVEREKERMAFVPQDYWTITGTCTTSDGQSFGVRHKTERFFDEQQAKQAFSQVQRATTGTVADVTRKRRSRPAPTPFNTTSLQTTASSACHIRPTQVMRIAESLYMSGYISYPRVDNTVYPDSIDLAGTVRMLAENPAYAPYARKLLARPKLTPTRGKMQTTDHPPIHPVAIATQDDLRPDEWKIYNLIARRFMATLSDAAQIEGTRIELDVNGQPFTASGDVIVDPGYFEIYPYDKTKDEELPAVSVGDVLGFGDAQLNADQTKPPARYTQARLIQKMEDEGLGTKSTRPTIIDRLQTVRYVQAGDPLEPTQLGMAVIDVLGQYASRIVSPLMTSELEDEMSQISVGQQTFDNVVGHSRNLLDEIIETLIPEKDQVGEALAEAIQADARVGACPTCGHDLLVKTSNKNKSRFVGCSNWPDCDVTYPLPAQGKIEAVEQPCPACGAPQIKWQPFRSKPRIMCIDPSCSTNFEPSVDVGACKACEEAGRQSRLIAQKNPKTLKRFIRCENYDECNTSYPLPPRGTIESTGERCPECGAPLVTIVNNGRPWKLCPNYDCSTNQKAKGASSRGRGRSAATTKSTAAKSTTAKKTSTTKKSTATKKSTTAKKASTTKKASATKKSTTTVDN